MKIRLLGAAVLIALLVIFVPMFFPSSPPPASSSEQSVSLAIPPAQDGNLQTRTMNLSPNAPAGSGTVAPAAQVAATGSAAPAAAPTGGQVSEGGLASVNIPSRRPTDVGTDAAAPKKPAQTGPVMGSGASPSQPVIPLQGANGAGKPGATSTPIKAAPAPTPAATPAAVAAAPTAAPATAGSHAMYVLNLSAYANANSVDRLVRKVRAFGYPVLTRMITQADKQLTLVTAGPFDSRAAAEAARLKITQSIPGVPAKLVEGLGHADSTIAATPVKTIAKPAVAPAAPPAASHAAPVAPAPQPATRAGGFAVQLAALGSEADANALRDKLRSNGFDGFVDSVTANGKRLWRVRAGPQTQRADAVRVQEQIKAKLGISGNVVTVP